MTLAFTWHKMRPWRSPVEEVCYSIIKFQALKPDLRSRGTREAPATGDTTPEVARRAMGSQSGSWQAECPV